MKYYLIPFIGGLLLVTAVWFLASEAQVAPPDSPRPTMASRGVLQP